MVKVSICIVTYNHEKYISQAIESALSQVTNFDYEIVIGEDCSTDKTRSIVEAYKKKHPSKIRLLSRSRNYGMMKNWISTIRSCEGQFVAILEGDDYWTDPNKLQKQVSFLESNPEFSITTHNVRVINERSGNQSEWYGKNHKSVSTLSDILQYGSGGATCSIVFRNNVFGVFPKWYSKLPGGDWTLQVLCAKVGKMYYFSESMGVYRKDHPNNSTALATTRAASLASDATGVSFKNTILTIRTVDKYFNYRYKDLLGNQLAYCNYLLAIEYQSRNDFTIARKYALLVLKDTLKFYPYVNIYRIFRLIKIIIQSL